MSSAVRAIALRPEYDPVGELGAAIREPLSSLRSALKDRFVRFMNGLPEQQPDVDLEALVRFPVPV